MEVALLGIWSGADVNKVNGKAAVQTPSGYESDLWLRQQRFFIYVVCYITIWCLKMSATTHFKSVHIAHTVLSQLTPFFDFATREYSAADESSCFQDWFTSAYFGGGKLRKIRLFFK